MSSSVSKGHAGGVGVQMARGQLVLGCTEDQRGWKPIPWAGCSGFEKGMGIPALCQGTQPLSSCSLWIAQWRNLV